MGVQVIQNPLFLKDLYQDNRAPIEGLEKRISSLKNKAFAFDLLSKISIVAILAIAGTILFVSYAAVTLPGGLMAAIALSSPFFGWGITKCKIVSSQYLKQAELQNQVLLKFREIAHWKTPEIAQFIRQQGLIFEQIPLEGLRQLNPEEPHLPLLPLIATVNYLKEKSQQIADIAIREIPQLEEGFVRQEEEGHQIDREIKQKLSFEARDLSWRRYEQGAIPLAIQAANLLELIQNPTKPYELETFTLEIPHLGSCRPRSFAERTWGQMNPYRKDDDYFFFEEANRAPLTFEEIKESDLDPSRLRLILFPREVRG